MDLLKKMLGVRGVGDVGGFGVRRLFAPDPLPDAGSGRTVKTGGLQRALARLATDRYEVDGMAYRLMSSSEESKLSALPTAAQLQVALGKKADVSALDGKMGVGGLECVRFDSVQSVEDGGSIYVDELVAEMILFCGRRYEVDFEVLFYDMAEQMGDDVPDQAYVAIYFDLWETLKGASGQVGSPVIQLSFDIQQWSVNWIEQFYFSSDIGDIVWADEPVFTAGHHYVLIFSLENGRWYADWREYAVGT